MPPKASPSKLVMPSETDPAKLCKGAFIYIVDNKKDMKDVSIQKVKIRDVEKAADGTWVVGYEAAEYPIKYGGARDGFTSLFDNKYRHVYVSLIGGTCSDKPKKRSIKGIATGEWLNGVDLVYHDKHHLAIATQKHLESLKKGLACSGGNKVIQREVNKIEKKMKQLEKYL